MTGTVVTYNPIRLSSITNNLAKVKEELSRLKEAGTEIEVADSISGGKQLTVLVNSSVNMKATLEFDVKEDESKTEHIYFILKAYQLDDAHGENKVPVPEILRYRAITIAEDIYGTLMNIRAEVLRVYRQYVE